MGLRGAQKKLKKTHDIYSLFLLLKLFSEMTGAVTSFCKKNLLQHFSSSNPTTCFRPFSSLCGISYLCYADDTELILSYLPSLTHSSACLSAYQPAHQLRLNPSMPELLYITVDASSCQASCDLPGEVYITPYVKALSPGTGNYCFLLIM